jgi:hypothetical protein
MQAPKQRLVDFHRDRTRLDGLWVRRRQVPGFLLGGLCRAAFGAEAVVSGFANVVSVGETVEEHRRHLGVARQRRLDIFLRRFVETRPHGRAVT